MNKPNLKLIDITWIDEQLTKLANTEIKSDNHKASLLIQIMVYEKVKNNLIDKPIT